MPRILYEKSSDSEKSINGNRLVGGKPVEFREAVKEAVAKNQLVEKLIRIAKGEKVDTYTYKAKAVRKGKIVSITKTINIPPDIRDQMKAIIELVYMGHGRHETKKTYGLSQEIIDFFQTRMIAELRRVIPTMCPHCKTHLRLDVVIADTLIKLSKEIPGINDDTQEEEATVYASGDEQEIVPTTPTNRQRVARESKRRLKTRKRNA